MSEARTNPEVTNTGRGEPIGSESLPVKAVGTMVLPNKVIPKAEVPEVAGRLVETLGEFLGAMERYVMLKQAGEIVKSACEQSLDNAFLKMRGKEMDCLGATVKTRPLVEYDYGDDATLRHLEETAEVLKSQIDERRKFLRSIKEPVASIETGEIIQPATKTRDGQTLVVSFK